MRSVTDGPVTGRDLFGREAEIRSLWRSLENGEHVLMLAPHGVGKSSLGLALKADPRPRWDVVYVDLHAGSGGADLMSVLLAALVSDPAYREWALHIRLPGRLRHAVGQAAAAPGPAAPWAAIREALEEDWRGPAKRIHTALRRRPQPTNRLLVILDELPYLMAKALVRPGGIAETEAIGDWLQAMQDDPALAGRVHFLFCGSSGLENVLRQIGLARPDGRVAAFAVDTWDRATARAFLVALGEARGFPLDPGQADALLGRLDDLVPRQVRLLFDALRAAAGDDPARITDHTLDAAFDAAVTGPEGAALFDPYRERLEVVFRPREVGLARYCLNRLAPHRDGLPASAVEPKDYGAERPFPLVLRLLEEEGYIVRGRRRLRFRSNLVREWWRRTQMLR